MAFATVLTFLCRRREGAPAYNRNESTAQILHDYPHTSYVKMMAMRFCLLGSDDGGANWATLAFIDGQVASEKTFPVDYYGQKYSSFRLVCESVYNSTYCVIARWKLEGFADELVNFSTSSGTASTGEIVSAGTGLTKSGTTLSVNATQNLTNVNTSSLNVTGFSTFGGLSAGGTIQASGGIDLFGSSYGAIFYGTMFHLYSDTSFKFDTAQAPSALLINADGSLKVLKSASVNGDIYMGGNLVGTQTWVTNQAYANQSWVNSQGFWKNDGTISVSQINSPGTLNISPQMTNGTCRVSGRFEVGNNVGTTMLAIGSNPGVTSSGSWWSIDCNHSLRVLNTSSQAGLAIDWNNLANTKGGGFQCDSTATFHGTTVFTGRTRQLQKMVCTAIWHRRMAIRLQVEGGRTTLTA